MLPKHLKKRGICLDWSTVRLKKCDMLREAIKVKMPTVTWGLNVDGGDPLNKFCEVRDHFCFDHCSISSKC